jgi:hypothetical protein
MKLFTLIACISAVTAPLAMADKYVSFTEKDIEAEGTSGYYSAASNYRSGTNGEALLEAKNKLDARCHTDSKTAGTYGTLVNIRYPKNDCERVSGTTSAHTYRYCEAKIVADCARSEAIPDDVNEHSFLYFFRHASGIEYKEEAVNLARLMAAGKISLKKYHALRGKDQTIDSYEDAIRVLTNGNLDFEAYVAARKQGMPSQSAQQMAEYVAWNKHNLSALRAKEAASATETKAAVPEAKSAE